MFQSFHRHQQNQPTSVNFDISPPVDVPRIQIDSPRNQFIVTSDTVSTLPQAPWPFTQSPYSSPLEQSGQFPPGAQATSSPVATSVTSEITINDFLKSSHSSHSLSGSSDEAASITDFANTLATSPHSTTAEKLNINQSPNLPFGTYSMDYRGSQWGSQQQLGNGISATSNPVVADNEIIYIPTGNGSLTAITWKALRDAMVNGYAGGPSSIPPTEHLSEAAKRAALVAPIQTSFSKPLVDSDSMQRLSSRSDPGPNHQNLTSDFTERRGHPHQSEHRRFQSNPSALSPHQQGMGVLWPNPHVHPVLPNTTPSNKQEVELRLETPSQPLSVLWDPEFNRPMQPTNMNGARGDLIHFRPEEHVRVFRNFLGEEKEMFPWSQKGHSNFWTRGQAMHHDPCPCQDFKVYADNQNTKDLWKRPSVLRKHFAECPKWPCEHPFKRLCALQRDAESVVRLQRTARRGLGTSRQGVALQHPQPTPVTTHPPFFPDSQFGI